PKKRPIRAIFTGLPSADVQSAKRVVQSATTMTFAIIGILLPLRLSSNHPIRSRQHIGWNNKANLFGGFEIDHQLKLGRLLAWKFGGLGTFQNLVDIAGRTAPEVKLIRV